MTSGSTEETSGDIGETASEPRPADLLAGSDVDPALDDLAAPAEPDAPADASAAPGQSAAADADRALVAPAPVFPTGGSAPADDLPADDLPADDLPADEFPADDFSAGEAVPADKSPAGDGSAGDADPDATRLDSRALDLRSSADPGPADPDATRLDPAGLRLPTGAGPTAPDGPADSEATRLTSGGAFASAFDAEATRLGNRSPGTEPAVETPAPRRTPSRAADAPRVLTPGTMLDDRYHLVAVAAIRGPVTLWRGDDRILARAVAVRVIEHGPDRADGDPDAGDPDAGNPDDDSDAAALDRAADLLLSAAINSGRLVHPGAASTYDATTINSSIGRISYVVSEWVEGVSLAGLLSEGPLRPQRAAAIVLAAARVVAAAHARGLTHGDLHPDDVIVSGHGPVKVTDLEIGAAVAEIDGDPGDISPAEVPDGRDRDLLALGALLYAALTARWPLAADRGLPAPPTVPDGRICTPRQVRAGVPRDLEAVTLAALGDDRAHRQALSSAAALVAELEQLAPGDELLDPDAAENFANQPIGVLHTRGPQTRANQTRANQTGANQTRANQTRANPNRGAPNRGPQTQRAPAQPTQAQPAQTQRTQTQGTRGIREPGGQPTRGTRFPAGPGREGYTTTGYPTGGHGLDGYGTNAYQAPGYEAGPRYLDPRRTPPDDGGRHPGPPRHRRSMAVPLIAIITVVAVIAIIIIAIRKTDGGTPGAGGSASPTVAASAAALPKPQVTAFDPSPGDGVEGNPLLANLTDGNPATSWKTEAYNQQITRTKAGVGVVLDFGSAVRPRTLTIGGLQGGATTFEVRAADTAPTAATTLAAFPKIAGPTTLSTGDTIQIASPGAHRYWLVWLTNLPQLPDGRYQAVIGELTFHS